MVIVIFVTAPRNRAHILAKKILRDRLCACVNIVSDISSYFWWKDKIEKEKESLLIIKTKENIYKSVEKAIKKYHPYTVPEIIALKINDINKEYLRWLSGEVKTIKSKIKSG